MGSLKVSPKGLDAVLIDTNILIDYIDGYPEPRSVLARIKEPAISIVTWIEVLAGARNADEESLLKSFLGGWRVIHLSLELAGSVAQIRRERRLKLPDAIIWATAKHERRKLLTRNTKDFGDGGEDVIVPYQLTKLTKRN